MTRAKTQSGVAQLNEKIHLSPEAQQISSILENCISNMRIAAALPAVLQSDTLSNAADKKLRELLKKHQVLAENVEREGAEHESQKEREEETGKAKTSSRAHLEKDIKNSTRDVLRYFRTHPDTASGLKAELLSMEIGESEGILIRNLEMFHSHMLEKLQASLGEEPQLPTLSSLTNDLRQIILTEEKLHPATTQSSEGGNDARGHVTSPLTDSQGGNDRRGDVTSPLTDSQEQKQPQLKTHSTKQMSMQQEIDRLNAQLYNLMRENSQAESTLQEKNEQVEVEIESLLKNFDNEMEESQATLESNEQIYEKEQEELRKLESLCANLEEEYNQIQERHRLAEEKRQEDMKELELKTKAAVYAQAWWRGYSTRKALKNKGKSKKKAKKGKGKMAK
ncbi:dynein regulatory complex protein 10 isoform X2 [Salarias fasciatus]|nr:dynein regulatory complex protein 10 isoform X2 [Salarias fasciatus]